MSDNIPSEFYPVMLLQDRYGGCYSRGAWIAIREANELFKGVSRAAWVVENGPSGNDLDAAGFWSDPPDWVAVGASPETAIRALLDLEVPCRHHQSITARG